MDKGMLFITTIHGYDYGFRWCCSFMMANARGAHLRADKGSFIRHRTPKSFKGTDTRVVHKTQNSRGPFKGTGTRVVHKTQNT
jgi:hypothetical protein